MSSASPTTRKAGDSFPRSGSVSFGGAFGSSRGISGRGTKLYYTDAAVCTEGGLAVDRNGGAFTDASELLRLAYEAFLLGGVERVETAGGWRCTVTLDGAQMTELAGVIAPETRAMDVSFEEGTVRLEIADGAAASMAVQCRGAVRVVRVEVPAAVGAKLTFTEGGSLSAPRAGVREALGLENG